MKEFELNKKLKKIAKDTVIQGGHRIKIIEYYCELIRAFREQFTDDNRPTQDQYLDECHREALGKS